MSVVNEHISRFSPENKKLLLACSGGVDSVVLFSALVELGIPFAVLHVNYQLRGEESDRDEAFVVDLCERYRIPYRVFRCPTNLTKGGGVNLQNQARKFRHALFKQWTNLSENHFVLLAHHADDQLETFFLQYFRGSGSFGLGGMSEKKNQLLRPFLSLSKQDILKYANAHHLEWREDASNNENVYLRNRFRNQLLPHLKQEIPNLMESVILFQEYLRIETSNLEATLSKKISEIIQSREIMIDTWNELGEVGQLLLIRRLGLASWVKRQLRTIAHSHLSAESFAGDYHFIKGQNKIHFRKKNEGMTYWEYKILEPNEIVEKSNTFLFCSDKLLNSDFIIRPAQPDDKIQLRGMHGKKSVWDLLKSAGIPKQLRRKQAVLEHDGEILWIPNFAVAHHPFVENLDSSTVCIALIEKVK